MTHLDKRLHLFLCRRLVGLVLGALLADTHQAGVGAGGTELLVGGLLGGVVGELALGDGGGVDDGEDGGGRLDVGGLLGGLDVLGRGVALLGRLGLAREEDELALVSLQALDVGLERLLGEVLAAGVDRDANGGSELAGNASSLGCVRDLAMTVSSKIPYLQLSKGEATASTHAAVVLDGRAADDGPQLVDGAGSDLSSLGLASIATALLLAGLWFRVSGHVCLVLILRALQAPLLSREGNYLVKVHADTALPILAEICILSAMSCRL